MIDFDQLAKDDANFTLAIEAGRVFVIRCIPDPFTQERINIGACVVQPNGKRIAKVINDAGRLECLYGDDGASIILSLAKTAGVFAEQGLASPSEQIIFDIPTPFYNSSSEEILEATFANQVTVAIPRRSEKSREVLDDATALTIVSDAIKQRLGIKSGELLANTPNTLIFPPKGPPQSVFVPLQPNNGVGTIRSADYTAQTLRLHLYESRFDLEFAASHRHKKHMGIFLLRPSNEDINSKAWQASSAVIDSIMHKKPKDLYLAASDSSDELAGEIAEWAKAAT